MIIYDLEFCTNVRLYLCKAIVELYLICLELGDVWLVQVDGDPHDVLPAVLQDVPIHKLQKTMSRDS